MKILICGSRIYQDREAIKQYIDTLPKDTIIIHGNARGADSIAGYLATVAGLTVQAFTPDWHIYGRAAGLIRNQQMLDEKPDLVVWFSKNLATSRGTSHMISIAMKAGILVTDGEE